jgi:hypothetical protein
LRAPACTKNSTPDGRTTTLGRNGSDYTATLIGAGLLAEAVVVNTGDQSRLLLMTFHHLAHTVSDTYM